MKRLATTVLTILVFIYCIELNCYELKIECGNTGIAGQAVKVKITAVDEDGTLVSNEKEKINLNGKLLLKTTGDDSRLDVREISKSEFDNGTIEKKIEYRGTGVIQFVLIDRETGYIARSSSITFLPAQEKYYKSGLLRGSVKKAGEEFEIGISIFDEYDNKILLSKSSIQNIEAGDFIIESRLKDVPETIAVKVLKIKKEQYGVVATVAITVSGFYSLNITGKNGNNFGTVETEILSGQPAKVEISSETIVNSDAVLNFEIGLMDKFGNGINVNQGLLKFNLTDLKNPAISYKTEYPEKSYIADRIRMIRAGNYRIEAVYENKKDNLKISGERTVSVLPGGTATVIADFSEIDKNNYALKPSFKFLDNNRNLIGDAQSNIYLNIDGYKYLIENEMLNKGKILIDKDLIKNAGITETPDTGRLNKIICAKANGTAYKIILCASGKKELNAAVSPDRKSVMIDMNGYVYGNQSDDIKIAFIDDKLKNCIIENNQIVINLKNKFEITEIRKTNNTNITTIAINVSEKSNDNRIMNNRLNNICESYKYNISDIENLFALRFEKIKDKKILNKISLIDK